MSEKIREEQIVYSAQEAERYYIQALIIYMN